MRKSHISMGPRLLFPPIRFEFFWVFAETASILVSSSIKVDKDTYHTKLL